MAIKLGAPTLTGKSAATLIQTEFGAKTFPIKIKISNLVAKSASFAEVGLYLKPSINQTAEFGVVTIKSLNDLKRLGTSVEQVAESRAILDMVQVEEYLDGGQPAQLPIEGTFSLPVYDSVTGFLLSAIINGISYTFTYTETGLLKTVSGNGVTETYNWLNGQLQSITLA